MKLDLSNNKDQALREVEAFIQEMLADGIISEIQFGSMLMALSEAVAHSMSHNIHKGISIHCIIEDHFIDLSLMNISFEKIFNDESGISFFESKYPSMAMINLLADEVNFNESTHNLQMRFIVSTMQQKLSNQRANILAKSKGLSKKANFIDKPISYE